MHQNRRGRGPPSPLKLVQLDPSVSLRKRPKFTAPERPGGRHSWLSVELQAHLIFFLLQDAVGTIHIAASHRRSHGQNGGVPLSSLPSLSELAHDTRPRVVRSTSESPTTPQFPPTTPTYSPLDQSPVLVAQQWQHHHQQQQPRARSSSVASSCSSVDSNSSPSKSASSSGKSLFPRLW